MQSFAARIIMSNNLSKEANKMDCVFCKIIKGELPSCKLYEDDTTISIMDIADDVDGHILVILRRSTSKIFLTATAMRCTT